MKKQILSFTALLLALLLGGLRGVRAAERQRGFCFGFRVRRTAGKRGVRQRGCAGRHVQRHAGPYRDGGKPESAWRRSSAALPTCGAWQAGKDTLVAAADDTWTQFELGPPETVVNLGGVKEPSAEARPGAQPDFVIGSAKTAADVDLLPTLEQAGIPTAYFEVSTFEDYLAMLEVCTRVTGRPELYEQYGEQVRAQVDAAVARAEGKEGPSVLYLRARRAAAAR